MCVQIEDFNSNRIDTNIIVDTNVVRVTVHAQYLKSSEKLLLDREI